MYVLIGIWNKQALISTCISCNIGRRDLPDLCARSLRACISGKSRLSLL